MHLVFANTPSHDILRDTIFLPSLKEKWNCVNFELPYSGNGHYCTDSWYQAVVNRFTFCADFVRKHLGDIGVFADVDISFTRPVQKLIEQELSSVDICFQSDQHNQTEANTGFVAARCTPVIADLFDYLGSGNAYYTDQHLANILIKTKQMPCRYAFLPEIFATELTVGYIRLSEMLIYHSTLSVPNGQEKNSVDAKLRQHRLMKTRLDKLRG